jgi:hypothetical protein
MNGSAGCVAAAELVNLPVSMGEVGDIGDSLVVAAAPLPRSSVVVTWCDDPSAERPGQDEPIDCRWTCGSVADLREGSGPTKVPGPSSWAPRLGLT